MSHSTARTGPSGLVQPASIPVTPPASMALNSDLEAAFHQIRQIANRPAPGPVTDSIRFSIETAQGLAKHAPELYDMSPDVAARFRLIVNFLTTALNEADEQVQR